MTARQANRLKPGDKVLWQDPDGGLCSRVMVIRTIEVYDPESDDSALFITDAEDGELECWAHELSETAATTFAEAKELCARYGVKLETIKTANLFGKAKGDRQ